MLPVTSYNQARQNIHRFQTELANNEDLRNRAGYVRAWYAERTENGWIFAPSKFIGYQTASAENYLAHSANVGQRDGRETERTLSKWYEIVEPNSRLGRELQDALNKFLAAFGQAPNKLARINKPKEMLAGDTVQHRWSEDRNEELLKRISVDRQICGGRPCIKGTRMRVVDIVEAIAQGATRDELLEDFDYLTADDIAAALLYAARAADHRIVRTA
ncbi:MAG TPA: DUF433 domain-containing protein [Hyphomonadaceae bacterium]|nr:DUF433 domain-containing protein [Hyphomonadaceae bacterium]